tara:strand:- start:1267 stop:1713 length:447 start_codon:yes stop_codon:yes gene_type:complete
LREEEWRPVVGHEETYEVSSYGRLRSIDRIVVDTNGKRTRKFKGRELKAICANTGYHTVNLHKQNSRTGHRTVHRIVAEAFLGMSPREGMYVDHIDGDRQNNHVDNLRWAEPHVNNNNTPYTRYLRALLDQNNITYHSEVEFYESRVN